ncbi:solute carrier family 35 member B1 homolog [Cimex lectularius]|uniref:Uncharacterized protein n=1 Tax=Cimex lectularius TaxID=79782 RepID=A0A8I6RXT5_CIMLE|nr:solute carrier family 35 member B1 homolog [Cimex lectularius]
MSLRFAFIAGGIFSLYCLFAVLQEKLLKGTFGEEKERFTYVLPLLLVATVFNYCYAVFMKRLSDRTTEDTKIPTLYITCISLTYLLAMVTSFMALQWVSYPMQIVAKSAKPIPVMVMGVLIGHKSFPLRKYFIIILIVSGVALFLYREDKAVNIVKTSEMVGFGEILLFMSLLMDGLTNSMQERVMAKYKPKSDQLMLEMNKWSMLYLGLMVLVTGEGMDFLSFVQRHPSSILQIIMISFCGALGQFFIYLCLVEYGTLTCSVITTTRKFFTVFSSIIIFGHVLKTRQWVGIVFVFFGLFLDIYYGKTPKKQLEKK